MSAIDPRDLSDRALLAYLVLGDLPVRGWPGRRRAIAARILTVAIQTVTFGLILTALLGVVVLSYFASVAP